MGDLISYMRENILFMNNHRYRDTSRGLYSRNKLDKVREMSAVISGQGIYTQQSPGESTEGLEDRLNGIPTEISRDIVGKFRLGEHIDSIYQNLIGSYEGQEYINHLKSNGNGKSRPGAIDDIVIVNQGQGLVAATMPDSLRNYLIINQDFIYEYASSMSDATGLTFNQAIESVILHELNHRYGQTRSDLSGSEKQVEYNNDLSLIKFYTGLANKDVDNSDLYLSKAKLFSIRYDGIERKVMDEIISGAEEKLSQSKDDASEYLISIISYN